MVKLVLGLFFGLSVGFVLGVACHVPSLALSQDFEPSSAEF